MTRHEALHDYTLDHFEGLMMALNIRRTVEDGLTKSSAQVLAIEMRRYWEQELLPHFNEEETILLPQIEETLDEKAKAITTRVRTDHEWIRTAGKVAIQSLLDMKPNPAQLRALAEKLDGHIRFEERTMFPWMQNNLTGVQMQNLKEWSESYRLVTRPHAIGLDRS